MAVVIYEATAGGRCALWSPDPPLEPQNGALHLHRAQRIYIIDLQKTVKKLEEAYAFVRDLSANGGNVLFVGTKKQAQDAIKEEATRCGGYYVNARWLGGMLTNFRTMRTRIDRLAQLRKMEEDAPSPCCPRRKSSSIRPRSRSWRSIWAA